MDLSIIISIISIIIYFIVCYFLAVKIKKAILQGRLAKENKEEYPELKNYIASGWKKVKT